MGQFSTILIAIDKAHSEEQAYVTITQQTSLTDR